MKQGTFFKALKAFSLLIGFGLVGWGAFSRPDWLLFYGIFTAIPGYFLIFLCLTPVGSIRLGDPSERINWAEWGWKIARAHVILIIFTMVVAIGFFCGGPKFVPKIDFSEAFSLIESNTKWQWGIFPWGLYGLWGVCIAYAAYVKKGPPYMYALVRGLCPRWAEPVAKTIMEATQFTGTAMVIGAITVGIPLMLSYVVEMIFHISHNIFPLVTLSYFSVLVILGSLKSTRKRFQHLKEKVTLAHIVSVAVLAIGVILIASAFSNSLLIQKVPELLMYAECKRCGEHFSKVPQVSRFAALYWGWWVIWVPLAGSYLARLAKGRTVREVIIGLYIFPAGLWLGGKMLSHFPWIVNSIFSHLAPVVIVILIAFPFLAWIGLAKMLRGVNRSDFMYSGFMTVSDSFRRTRLWADEASKCVGLSLYGKRIVGLIFGTLIFQITAGWYGLQIQLTAMGIVVINSVYLAFIFITLRFFQDHAWGRRGSPQNIPSL